MTKKVDTDKNINYCSGCNKSYSSQYTLKRHINTTDCGKKIRKTGNQKKSQNNEVKVKGAIETTINNKKNNKKENTQNTNEDNKNTVPIVEAPQPKETVEVDPIISHSSLRSELDNNNELLELNHNRLRIINESMNRAEQDIKDIVCDKYVIARLRDALAVELVNDIKQTNLYSENKHVIDECIKYFNPSTNVNYTVENVLVNTLENRIDVIKSRADNLSKLKQNKLDLLIENAKLTNKIIELLK